MTLFTMLLWLAAADPKPELSDYLDRLYGKDPAASRQAYRDLESIASNSGEKHVDAAKAQIAEYDRRYAAFSKRCEGPVDRRNGFLWLRSVEGIAPKDMAMLYAFPNLDHFSCDAKNFGDKHLQYLSGIRNLHLLTFYGDTSLTGSGVAELELPNLILLALEDIPVTDDVVCALNFPKLQVLNLNNTKVTNKALAGCQMTKLRAIYLFETAIDRDGLKSLVRFSELEELKIDLAAFDPAIFALVEARKVPLKILTLRCKPAEAGDAAAIKVSAPEGCSVRIFVAP